MKKFDYKLVTLPEALDAGKIEFELDAIGGDGFELICIIRDRIAVFKRELAD